MNQLQNEALFKQMNRVADLVLSYVTCDRRLGDQRKEPVNPFYNQTESGLYLEAYYGLPSILWTPWGKWSFSGWGSGDWDPVWPELIQRLGATVFRPLIVDNILGEFGPIYALHSIDAEPLPEPKLRMKDTFLEYNTVKEAWTSLTM